MASKNSVQHSHNMTVELPRLPPLNELVELPGSATLDVRETYHRNMFSKRKFSGANDVIIEQSCLDSIIMAEEKFSHLGLEDVEFSDCDLANCDIALANWGRVRLRSCRLTGLSIAKGRIFNTTFEQSQFDYGQLWEAKLKRVHFIRCNLTNCNFEGAELNYVRFQQCDLTGVSMRGASLANVDLDDSKLSGLIVELEQLRGVTLNMIQAAVLLRQLTGVSVRDR